MMMGNQLDGALQMRSKNAQWNNKLLQCHSLGTILAATNPDEHELGQ